MRKAISLLMLLAMLPLAGCTAKADQRTGEADGYGGKVIVTVTVRDGKMTEIATENTGGDKSEYYLKAEEALIAEILEKQSLEGIDTVAGATGTSESILSAMQGIWEQMNYTGTPSQEPVNSVKEPTLTAWPKPTV